VHRASSTFEWGAAAGPLRFMKILVVEDEVKAATCKVALRRPRSGPELHEAVR
jgi:hypothetical protein